MSIGTTISDIVTNRLPTQEEYKPLDAQSLVAFIISGLIGLFFLGIKKDTH